MIMAWNTFVQNTKAKASEVNENFTALNGLHDGDTITLGSGSGTITGSGSAQNLGSFSTTAGITAGVIQVYLDVERTAGATNWVNYISATSATASGIAVGTSSHDFSYVVRLFPRASDGAAKWMSVDEGGTSGNVETDFDLSAAEDFYLTANPDSGTNFSYVWVATLTPFDNTQS